jgi:hypothetical protein
VECAEFSRIVSNIVLSICRFGKPIIFIVGGLGNESAAGEKFREFSVVAQ